MSNLKILMNGIITENPTFVLLLGMCPTLGTTSSAINGMSMGLATMFVLICSNIVISALKNVIPDLVRIPGYIVVIATFVTVVQMCMEAFVPALYASLGLFIPLIVVNCIVLGRAEAFAAKNNPVASMFTSMKKVDAAMGVYLATVFCFGFAMMAYDNYFSYFLRDQLGFPTSVNGYFKALIGVIAIIANSTINMWINKHTDVRKSITVILAMSSVSVAMMVSFKSVLPFMASALVYYTFNAITVPVLQVMMMKDEDKNQAGTISGLYNAFWALGRTVGPLIAAFVYGINPLYPFMLAAVLSIWNRFQYKNRKPRLVTE